jgi:hypothetical protein
LVYLNQVRFQVGDEINRLHVACGSAWGKHMALFMCAAQLQCRCADQRCHCKIVNAIVTFAMRQYRHTYQVAHGLLACLPTTIKQMMKLVQTTGWPQ